MRWIDGQFLETLFFGVRQMTWRLRNDGHLVNEKRIHWLMRLMGLMPIDQKPNASRPAKGHKTYPYLLRGLRVDRPNEVSIRRGFLGLIAIMGWHTRKVLSSRVSNALDADFCVEAPNKAIHTLGAPETMNTDSHGIETRSRINHSPGWCRMAVRCDLTLIPIDLHQYLNAVHFAFAHHHPSHARHSLIAYGRVTVLNCGCATF